MGDIVLDTNVFAHAGNPNDMRFGESVGLMNNMMGLEVVLCVDEGFSLIESENKSRIGHEYLEVLRAGSIGMETVIFLAKRGRINVKSRKVPNRVRKIIRMRVYDPSDLVFVKVAYNSEGKLLVTHDYEHYNLDVRKGLEKDISVIVVDAEEANNIIE